MLLSIADTVLWVWYCAVSMILCCMCLADTVLWVWYCAVSMILCCEYESTVLWVWYCAVSVIWCCECDTVLRVWYCAVSMILCCEYDTVLWVWYCAVSVILCCECDTVLWVWYCAVSVILCCEYETVLWVWYCAVSMRLCCEYDSTVLWVWYCAVSVILSCDYETVLWAWYCAVSTCPHYVMVDTIPFEPPLVCLFFWQMQPMPVGAKDKVNASIASYRIVSHNRSCRFSSYGRVTPPQLPAAMVTSTVASGAVFKVVVSVWPDFPWCTHPDFFIPLFPGFVPGFFVVLFHQASDLPVGSLSRVIFLFPHIGTCSTETLPECIEWSNYLQDRMDSARMHRIDCLAAVQTGLSQNA